MAGNERFKLSKGFDGLSTIVCTPSFTQAITQLEPYFPEYVKTLKRIIDLQQRMLYHRKVFSAAAARQREPVMHAQYERAVEAWKKLTDCVNRFSVVRGFCVDDECLETLDITFGEVEALEATVRQFLENSRQRFAFFHHVGDQELLQLLLSPLRSSAGVGESSMPSLSGMADFESLVFEDVEEEDENEQKKHSKNKKDSAEKPVRVVGLRGRDGTIFFLDVPVTFRGSVSDMFHSVFASAHLSLKAAIVQAVKTSPVIGLSGLAANQEASFSRLANLPSHLLLYHPPQVAEILLRLRFTKAVEDHLVAGVPLTALVLQEDKLLKSFALALRSNGAPEVQTMARDRFGANPPLSVAPETTDAREITCRRQILERLLSVHMTHVHALREVVLEGVERVNDWAWQRQTRHYWSDVRGTLLVSSAGVDVEFGYTYHDWVSDDVCASFEPELAQEVLASWRTPAVLTAVASRSNGLPATVSAVRELARVYGRRCHVCRIPKRDINLSDVAAMVDSMASAAGALWNTDAGVGALHQFAAAFATGTWLALVGLENCSFTQVASLRVAFESYATAMLRKSSSVDHCAMHLGVTNSRTHLGFTHAAGQPAQVQRTVVAVCMPSEKELEGTFESLPRLTPALAAKISDNDGMATGLSLSAASRRNTGGAKVRTLAILHPVEPQSAVRTMPPLLASVGGFSLESANQAAALLHEVQELLSNRHTDSLARRVLPCVTSFHRWVCGVAVALSARHLSSPTATETMSALSEADAAALAIHCLILPRLTSDEGLQFLRHLHGERNTVDFLWLYAVHQMSTKNHIMAEIAERGLQLGTLPEVWRPDTPPNTGIAGQVSHLAKASPNRALPLAISSPIGNSSSHIQQLGSPTMKSPVKDKAMSRSGPVARRKPTLPKDGLVIRIQAIVLALRCAVTLHVGGLLGSSGVSPIQVLAPSQHIVIIGEQGSGKTIAFHLIRSSMQGLPSSLATLSHAVPVTSADPPRQTPEGNTVRLPLTAQSKVSDLIGVMDAQTLRWIDGSLVTALRAAVRMTTPILNGLKNPNAHTLARRTSTHHMDDHIWIIINGLPPPVLVPIFTDLIVNQRLVLSPSDVLELNPFIHIVFELPMADLVYDRIPQVLYATCQVLLVPQGALKQQQRSIHADRPGYIDNDVSGAMVSEYDIKDAFEELDVDGKGWIPKQDFIKLYGKLEHYGMEREEMARMQVALNKMVPDDRVTFQEFALVMLRWSRR